jgi:cytochrome oxidase Cu insertion factor (SCO1/SenC/PrrC family)
MFKRMLPLALLALAPVTLVLAQGPLLPPDVRFESGPKVGELVPDVTIVDDQGNPVSLRDVARGHYTVMTLGCLT